MSCRRRCVSTSHWSLLTVHLVMGTLAQLPSSFGFIHRIPFLIEYVIVHHQQLVFFVSREQLVRHGWVHLMTPIQSNSINDKFRGSYFFFLLKRFPSKGYGVCMLPLTDFLRSSPGGLRSPNCLSRGSRLLWAAVPCEFFSCCMRSIICCCYWDE